MNQETFILHHQMNVIRSEINKVKYALQHTADKRVQEGVRCSAEAAIVQLFPTLSEEHTALLFSIKALQTDTEWEEYISRCASYEVEFPKLSEKQLQKLFPKNKKLKLPELEDTAVDKLTYLSWVDIATGRLYMVYPLLGTMVGVECRFTVSNKQTVCAVCNSPRSPEQIGLVTAVCKHDRSSSPDYYKSIGNYMCLDSIECNKHIKDVTYLETFLHEVLGNRVSCEM